MTEQDPKTVAELLKRIDAAWNTFRGYLDTLTEAQLTQPTDAAGWTAKDHLIHIATWEDTRIALLEKTPLWERLNIDKALWERHDVDAINAVVQKRYQHMPLVEVRQKLQDVHQALTAKIRALSEHDLHQAVPESQSVEARTVARHLLTDTAEAYEEHTPWIAAIVARA